MENTFATGGIEMEKAQSHFELGAVTPEIERPAVFMPSYGLVIENQAKQPACGAHAGYEVAGILKTIEKGSVQHGSPEYLWKNIKKIDGFPIEAGTNMLSIFRALGKKGICDSSLLPNNAAGQSLTEYASAASITNEMDLNAINNRIADGVYAFTWSPTFEEIKQAIFVHKAVIVLASIGDEFWLPSWSEKDLLPLRDGRPYVSGHFFTAFAYDEDNIYFYNHWTDKWGRNGIGYFNRNYQSHILQIGSAVNLPGNFEFKRTLTDGATGTDVGILQMLLKKENCFPQTVSVTSYFGPITRRAVANFQQKYATEILVPAGATLTTGFVGVYTLKKLNSLIATK